MRCATNELSNHMHQWIQAMYSLYVPDLSWTSCRYSQRHRYVVSDMSSVISKTIYTILYLGVIRVHILSLFFVRRNVYTLQEFHTITFNSTQSYSSNILSGIAITTMPLTTQHKPHLYWRAVDCSLLIAISDREKWDIFWCIKKSPHPLVI